MTRLLLSTAAILTLTLTLTLAGETRADNGDNPKHAPRASSEKKTQTNHSNNARTRSLHRETRNFRNWSSRWYYSARFHCYFFWNSVQQSWFYWYAPARCYLPFSSMSQFPATQSAAPINSNAANSLPAGEDPLPQADSQSPAPQRNRGGNQHRNNNNNNDNGSPAPGSTPDATPDSTPDQP